MSTLYRYDQKGLRHSPPVADFAFSPSGPETLDAFKEAASMASSESVPAHVQGGILSTEEEEAPSTTSPASGTPTNGGSPSGTASPTPSAPNDAKRLQFSIELGVVSVFTLMVAGVLM